MCEFGTCQDCLRSIEVLKGLPGLDGVNGISVLTGSGDPGVTPGVESQIYLDTTPPFNLFQYSSGAWQFLGQLQGVDGNGMFLSYTTTLDSATVANLFTAPASLVPDVRTSPSAQFIVSVDEVIARLNYVSRPYVVGSNNLVIEYNGSSVAAVTMGPNLLNATSDTIGKYGPNTNITGIPVGAGLTIKNQSSNPAGGGDGSLFLNIIYHLVRV